VQSATKVEAAGICNMHASAIKMDELLVNWLASDAVYESVLEWIENAAATQTNASGASQQQQQSDNNSTTIPTVELKSLQLTDVNELNDDSIPVSLAASTDVSLETSDTDSVASIPIPIPPFYPVGQQVKVKRRKVVIQQHDTWEPLPDNKSSNATSAPETAFPSSLLHPLASAPTSTDGSVDSMNYQYSSQQPQPQLCARDAVLQVFAEVGQHLTDDDDGEAILTLDTFQRITKEVCHFPSYFNGPLFQRVLKLWDGPAQPVPDVVTFDMIASFWATEMESYDAVDRLFRLVKQIDSDHIVRDDFLPFIKALLQDHPGLEFLSSHAEFQEKYAVTVVTRIFYSVNRCHSGRITARQIRRSDLLSAFHQVDAEEDINKVTRYFSYEHFYVLYCRFWELDHDRDYRITREDLLKYGDHSLSHMIVDRIFDAAPRPFYTDSKPNREYLSYEDFIYFMLSEEDKSNEVSVRYWFQCVDVDGDGKLNNMEMRSFYAVQLHRMQCMGHEIVPFEDMLCQMMDMIKPASTEYLVADDFLQPECCQVSGALFDALFNLNKYLMFEQRDPFVERQKREDEFSSDWDRFACIDYNRLAMEEEAREEEAMEIDWVTVDDEDDDDPGDGAAAPQQQPPDPDAGEAAF
jgi:serine/threonine-protein phosphatase 2A regulatory subunit B''